MPEALSNSKHFVITILLAILFAYLAHLFFYLHFEELQLEQTRYINNTSTGRQAGEERGRARISSLSLENRNSPDTFHVSAFTVTHIETDGREETYHFPGGKIVLPTLSTEEARVLVERWETANTMVRLRAELRAMKKKEKEREKGLAWKQQEQREEEEVSYHYALKNDEMRRLKEKLTYLDEMIVPFLINVLLKEWMEELGVVIPNGQFVSY
jgi:hypothetical protein